MRTKQLEKALKFNRDTRVVFKGVYAYNRLPRKIPKGKKVALIANTDPGHKPGTHWVAFFYTNTCVYFFDSMGNPPWKPGFQRLMQFRRTKRVFNTRIQGIGTVCGHYCLYFILAMVYNMDFSCFGDDLNANDRMVRKIVRKYFPVY